MLAAVDEVVGRTDRLEDNSNVTARCMHLFGPIRRRRRRAPDFNERVLDSRRRPTYFDNVQSLTLLQYVDRIVPRRREPHALAFYLDAGRLLRIVIQPVFLVPS